MCGIAGIFGKSWQIEQLSAMQKAQNHRGFDSCGIYADPQKRAGLAHNRLSIIDLSNAGNQPMQSLDGKLHLVFNGEIYNYLELRRELAPFYDFRTQTDTEVLLAAFQKWGTSALERLIGMFAFVIWDEAEKTAFAARDRFGVKPFYYHRNGENLLIASEIKAIHAAGIAKTPNLKTWANYLAHGITDNGGKTFWQDIEKLPAGSFLTWKDGVLTVKKWYDLAEKVGDEFDARSENLVSEEYLELLKDSVRLRFRADVPVGINLSGGVDSSTLLGLVGILEKNTAQVAAYTFTTGDERYDELPWVARMLEKTGHPLVVSKLEAREVPSFAASIQGFQDEPFGGIPTLAYAKLFATARRNGTIVLLDGNGLDEQWAGYNYYSARKDSAQIVQGTAEKPVKPHCLKNEFLALAEETNFSAVYPDVLRNLQYRDIYCTKLPRALRYNDRNSMHAATELREPFLDHRLFELAFRQPAERKVADGVHKKMLREIVKKIIPAKIVEAPKRALQTPQREWLRGALKDWTRDLIETGLEGLGRDWLDQKSVFEELEKFNAGKSDNSFYVWQWISLGLIGSKSGQMEKMF